MDFYPETTPVLPRPQPMRLLVLGLPRTGTTSLRILGLTPYHFSEATKNKNNRHYQLWLQAVRAKYDGIGEPFKGKDFDPMLWNYDAVTDDPCCLFVPELLHAYPDAKVVLTTRPRDSWVKSMRAYILEILTWRSWGLLSKLDHEFTAPYQSLLQRTTSVLTGGHPPGDPAAEVALRESFDRHNKEVESLVSGERLLKFQAKQGWEPLCSFLGLPVPEVPYPHLNSTPDAIKLEEELYWSRWACVGRRVARGVSIPALMVLSAVVLSMI